MTRPKNKRKADTLKDWLRDFSEQIPTSHPVRLSRHALPYYGDCELREGKGGKFFRIRIAKHLDKDAAFLVLAHEYAHALAHYLEPDPDDHGAAFGLAYAATWAIVCGEADPE